MKNKPENTTYRHSESKTPEKRLEILRDYSGRNLEQWHVKETIEIERRVDRLERLFKKYLPVLKQMMDDERNPSGETA